MLKAGDWPARSSRGPSRPTSKRLVAAELLEYSAADAPVFGAGYARVLEAGQPLLEAARRSGEVRADLSLEQILGLLGAIAKIPGDTNHREPILRAALDGLRPVIDGLSEAATPTGNPVAPTRTGLDSYLDRYGPKRGDLQALLSAPERIRTSDLRFRRPTLYPAELRAQSLPV